MANENPKEWKFDEKQDLIDLNSDTTATNTQGFQTSESRKKLLIGNGATSIRMNYVEGLYIGAEAFSNSLFSVDMQGYCTASRFKTALSGTRIEITNVSSKSSVVTITSAVQGVVSWTNHGFIIGTAVSFTTTGALPTNIVPSTVYYIAVTNYGLNSFSLAPTYSDAGAGTNIIDTSAGVQSGIHTCTGIPLNNELLFYYGTDPIPNGRMTTTATDFAMNNPVDSGTITFGITTYTSMKCHNYGIETGNVIPLSDSDGTTGVDIGAPTRRFKILYAVNNWCLISKSVVPLGNPSTVTFSSIPTDYNELRVRWYLHRNVDDFLFINFNADGGANYAYSCSTFSGGGFLVAGTGRASGQTSGICGYGSGGAGRQYMVGEVIINETHQTLTKNWYSQGQPDGDYSFVAGGTWYNTSDKITSIVLGGTATLASGGIFILEGRIN